MEIIDIAAIRTALAERCALVDGLWVYDYPSDNIQLGPSGAAVISDAELDDFILYHIVGGTADVVATFDVQIAVMATSEREANRLLDDYRGVGTPRSLVTLLEDTGALPGIPAYVRVVSAGPVRGFVQESGARHWAVTFRVEVGA